MKIDEALACVDKYWSITCCVGQMEAAKTIAAEVRRLRDFARDIRDNFNCDQDAHKYGTTCRCCEAAKMLGGVKE